MVSPKEIELRDHVETPVSLWCDQTGLQRLEADAAVVGLTTATVAGSVDGRRAGTWRRVQTLFPAEHRLIRLLYNERLERQNPVEDSRRSLAQSRLATSSEVGRMVPTRWKKVGRRRDFLEEGSP